MAHVKTNDLLEDGPTTEAKTCWSNNEQIQTLYKLVSVTVYIM